MFAITINGTDFTDRLLDPNGISNYNRARHEMGSFEPVGDTLIVRLSDHDRKVCDFLGINELSGLWEGALPVADDLFVEIYHNDTLFFNGYIAPGSEGLKPVNHDDPDDERIVSFTAMDRTTALFKKLNRIPWSQGARGPHGELRYQLADLFVFTAGLYSEIVRCNVSTLAEVLRFISGEVSGETVLVDPLYDGIWLNATGLMTINASNRRIYPVGFTKVTRGVADRQTDEKPVTLAEMLIELCTYFMAYAHVGMNGKFYFRPLNNVGMDAAYIDKFTVVEYPPIDDVIIPYVEDQRINNIGTGAELTVQTVYHTLQESTVFQPVEGGVTTTVPYAGLWSGDPVSVVPAIVSSFTPIEQAYFVVRPYPDGFCHPADWQRTPEKRRLIEHLLTFRKPIIVEVPDIYFMVGQPIVLQGLKGFVVREANIEPMEGKSTLTLDYTPDAANTPDDGDGGGDDDDSDMDGDSGDGDGVVGKGWERKNRKG